MYPNPELFPVPRFGVATKPITGNAYGQVKHQGSYWSASFYGVSTHLQVQPGDKVKIVGRLGNRLLVQPC